MQIQLSTDPAGLFFSRLLHIISRCAGANHISTILNTSLVFMIVLSFALPLANVFAQHMMMPPAASIGDRKITLSFHTEPQNVKPNQTLLTKLAFIDQNTKQTLQHVTVRMEISDTTNGRRLLSEFFHAHNGNIDIDFRPALGLKYAVTGNMDDLTNAWVADPGSPIIVNGPIFSHPGIYRTLLEVLLLTMIKQTCPNH